MHLSVRFANFYDRHTLKTPLQRQYDDIRNSAYFIHIFLNFVQNIVRFI